VVSDYRRKGAALDAAQVAFARAFQDVVDRRARDGRAALTTYRTYLRTLLDLQGENARLGAFVDADVATLVEAVFRAAAVMASSRVRRETRNMQRDLERLQDQFSRARREAVGAQVQRAINLLLGGIGVAVGFMTGVEEAAAAIAIGSGVISNCMDRLLGPTAPDDLGTTNTELGVLASISRDVRPAISTFTGCATTWISWLADNEEVATADRNLQSATDDLRRAERMFRDYARDVASASSDVQTTKRLAEAAIRNARSRARAFRESDAEYREMMSALSDLR
jgi:hypothetical protein